MQGQQPDPERLKAKLAEINAWEQRNVEPYDKAILTLSSGALALSLTFIKDLVPPEIAQENWILYLAWVLFVLSLSTNIIGFIYTLRSFVPQRRFVEDVYKHCTKTETQFSQFLKDLNYKVDLFNVFQGIFFLCGMVAFTTYVIINFEAHSRTAHQSKPPVVMPVAPPSAPAPAATKKPEP
jgi:hypothetical protein